MIFTDDYEKMVDFFVMSEEGFLNFYSYLTKDDYEETIKDIIQRYKENEIIFKECD